MLYSCTVPEAFHLTHVIRDSSRAQRKPPWMFVASGAAIRVIHAVIGSDAVPSEPATYSPLAGGHHHPPSVFRGRCFHRLLCEGLDEYQRRVLPGGPPDDSMDCGPQLRLSEPWLAGTDGVGGLGIPVRHSGDALVLDRRNSSDALPRHRDDAVLLHL